MKKNREILIAFGLIFTFLGVMCYNSIQEYEEGKKVNDEYFDKLKLHFSGVVYDKYPEESGHDRGVFLLKLTSSNTPEYDPIKSGIETFYCILFSKKAYVVEGGFYNTEKGDSVVVDGINKFYYVYRKKKEIIKRKMFLPPMGCDLARELYKQNK